VRTLRDQCPWDRAQTHASLRRHLLEETHETLEAIDARVGLDDDEYDDERDAHLAEELGDLLYQVFFHARIAAERGAFTVADVTRGIHDKLVVRHPHVFGDVELHGDDQADTVVANWEAIKKAEKGRDSAMDGVPPALPALLFALKVQQRAARSDVGVVAEPAETGHDLTETELGDLLFGLVEAARRLDVDPESALRAAASRFVARFREAEGDPPCGPG
jgi:MazG family protein